VRLMLNICTTLCSISWRQLPGRQHIMSCRLHGLVLACIVMQVEQDMGSSVYTSVHVGSVRHHWVTSCMQTEPLHSPLSYICTEMLITADCHYQKCPKVGRAHFNGNFV
jgi:hypothetical protein